MSETPVKIKITQTRSTINCTKKQKATIQALGLGRPNYSRVLNDNPLLRGQLRVVNHLIKVEEVSE
jgi:large subunit ribosomal protein L30